MKPSLINYFYFTWVYGILLFFSFLLYAEDNENFFEVRVATEASLTPLYILPFTSDESDLSTAYIQQLEQVFAFDLNHNGTTCVAKRSIELDQLAAGPFTELGSIQKWKENHLFYVIKAQVQGRALVVLILDVQKQKIKTADAIPLIGDLSKDRFQIHRLGDMIHKTLFGIDGIACSHILYTVTTKASSDSSKWISEVWETDYDGSNPRQVTHDQSYCVTPAYVSPKPGYLPSAFLYVSYQLGQPKIFINSLKGGKAQRVSPLRSNQLMPTFSKQRDKVAFISDITGNPDLFLQPFSPETGSLGKPQQIFSANQATQGSPSFSPDGKKIAFVSDKDGSPKIYMIQIPEPGTSIKEIRATLLTRRNRENSAPCWSPDGSKIAYCARGNGERQIWVYDFNTKKETQITQGAGNKENPSWAANSQHLTYNSVQNEHGEIFIINLNQLEAIQITKGTGDKRFPSWEPR